MATAVRVEGLRRAVRQLERAGVEVEDLKKAFSRVSNEAMNDIRPHIPRGDTGALAASLRASKTKNTARVYIGYKRVPYAGPINFGWWDRNIESTHFMQVVDDPSNANKYVNIIEQELDRLVARLNLN
ncbi:hypothetical protein OG984_06470 [Nocardioides sp. NBC_00368]|uniref:hypothetical protein n=1 Tax=Nocardioides sp. NBC_00368 TaxID=2976000 RepID=UPI002E20AED0